MITCLTLVLRSRWVNACITLRPTFRNGALHAGFGGSGCSLHPSELHIPGDLSFFLNALRKLFCPSDSPALSLRWGTNLMLSLLRTEWVSKKVFLLQEGTSHSPSFWRGEVAVRKRRWGYSGKNPSWKRGSDSRPATVLPPNRKNQRAK